MLQVVSPLKKAFEAEVRIMNYLGVHPSPASSRKEGKGGRKSWEGGFGGWCLGRIPRVSLALGDLRNMLGA